MISGAVENQRGMRAGRDDLGDFRQMHRHRLGVGLRQDERGGDLARRAGGSKNVGPDVALIARRAGSGSASGPYPRQRALLSDPGPVLKPDFERLAARRVWKSLRDNVGDVFWSETFFERLLRLFVRLGMVGPRRQATIAERVENAPDRALMQLDAEAPLQIVAQIDAPPSRPSPSSPPREALKQTNPTA